MSLFHFSLLPSLIEFSPRLCAILSKDVKRLTEWLNSSGGTGETSCYFRAFFANTLRSRAVDSVYWMPLWYKRRVQSSMRHEELTEDERENKQPGQESKSNEP